MELSFHCICGMSYEIHTSLMMDEMDPGHALRMLSRIKSMHVGPGHQECDKHQDKEVRTIEEK